MQRDPHFKSIPTKMYSKNIFILLVIGFRWNFGIFLSKFIKNIDDYIGESNCLDGMYNSKPTTFISTNNSKIIFEKCFIIMFLNLKILEKILDVSRLTLKCPRHQVLVSTIL